VGLAHRTLAGADRPRADVRGEDLEDVARKLVAVA
jgi:hypothetical protein